MNTRLRPLPFAYTGTLSLLGHGLFLGLLFRAPEPTPLPNIQGSPVTQDGETFEISSDFPASGPGALPGASPSPASPAAPASPVQEEFPASPPPLPPPPPPAAGPRKNKVAPPKRAGASAPPGSPSGDTSGAGESAVFGAKGERGSMDLATAFTRTFPLASSGDGAWIAAPFGSAGRAEVVLTLSPEGALVQVAVRGSPSNALARSIDRTLILLKARAFTARGAVTRLLLEASVEKDEKHDGLHGDVFALGGSFVQNEGTAFFALAVGRRINLRVRQTGPW